jgi:hypothetical protein
MAKTNMDVDFIDESNQADQDKAHTNRRAEIAHKLAVVMMFDRHGHKIREGQKNASTDTQKATRRKGALNGSA